MPTVYEDPAHYNLKPVGELQELRFYEGIFCHDWRIAVWDSGCGHLWYAVEDRFGNDKVALAPFANIDSLKQLELISDTASFCTFKHRLNDFWWSRQASTSLLTPHDRWARNRRNRLQRKVGRVLYANGPR